MNGEAAAPQAGGSGSASRPRRSPPTADPTFDRIRPRGATRPSRPVADPVPAGPDRPDHEGKRALFSGVSQPPVVGAVAITCSGCGRRSVVSWLRLARLSLPGLHVPFIEEGRPAWKAWLTCPACRSRTWVSIGVRL